MEEYIFKTTTKSQWQKWLNQWRYKYDLEVLKIYHESLDRVTIYLKRTPKKED